MTKRSRTLLFFFLSLLVLIATPILIFYALGYRINWQTRTISQTGGLYLKTIPANATVFINDKKQKNTDFLFGTVLIDNLLPKSYDIRIEKEGYKSWNKRLEVQEKQVAEAKNIILFPSQLNFKTLFDHTAAAWPSPDMAQILLQRQLAQSQSRLSLWNPKTNKETILVKQLSFALHILSVQWDGDSQNVLIQFREKTALPIVFDREGQQCKEPACATKILNAEPKAFEKVLAAAETDLLQTLPDKREEILSPDEKKVALTNGSEVWLFYLQNDEGQPRRTKGQRVLLSRFSESANHVTWMDNNHLLLSVGNDVRIIEIDDRDSINTYSLGSFPASSADKSSPEIFWGDQEKIVYILSNGIFSVSEKLIK